LILPSERKKTSLANYFTNQWYIVGFLVFVIILVVLISTLMVVVI
jgi:hypothetical protein